MGSLYKALGDFQSEVPTIKKSSSGYGYKYADLEEITEVIKPLLKKHGLGYTQPIVGTQLKTILFHIESGETIESTVDIPQGVELKGMNQFQVLGSAITYLRRYSLSCILGLVSDEDTDARGEQTSAPKASASRPATDKQLNLIRKLASEKGYTDDVIEARLAEIETAEQASESINSLKDN